jgi:cellulose synthase operon protein YhjQ
MTDRRALSDQAETPDDVATLYSWANLHGAKYRDFSAARAQTREKARLRVQDVIDEEQRRNHEIEDDRIRTMELEAALKRAQEERAADALHAAEEARAAEEAHRAEIAAQAAREAEWSRQQAAHQLELAAQQSAERNRQQATEQDAHRAQLQETDRAAQQAAAERAWQQARIQRMQAAGNAGIGNAGGPIGEQYGQQPQGNRQASAAYQGFQAYPDPMQQAMQQPVPEAEDIYVHPRAQWAQPEQREAPSRPAWLMADRPDAAAPHSAPAFAPQGAPPFTPHGAAPFAPPAPEDTLQGSRERMTSRWFALRSLYDPGAVAPEVAQAPVAGRAPVVAVFSLAGGVGKTSVVATLGRALAAMGERMLLVDTASFGLLPFFFGARDQRPGVLRTFSPPGNSADAAVQLITIDPEGLGADAPGQELLANEISRYARGANRVIVDLATASGATSRRIMRMQPLVLVPVVPDMNSVVSVSSIDAFFQHNSSQPGKLIQPYYILNQFDSSLPLNLDVREVLRAQLGDRLLPFVLRRAPAMSEALAEGMTVMDYAPNSSLAEDFNLLAGWVKSQSSPATTTYRGVRWSER